MIARRLVPGLLVLVCGVGLLGCFDTAVSAREKMVRACGDYADALEATSNGDIKRQVEEAARWTKHASEQDKSLNGVSKAFDLILLEVQKPNRKNRDATAVEIALERAVEGCDRYVDTDVRNRIHAALQ